MEKDTRDDVSKLATPERRLVVRNLIIAVATLFTFNGVVIKVVYDEFQDRLTRTRAYGQKQDSLKTLYQNRIDSMLISDLERERHLHEENTESKKREDTIKYFLKCLK